MASYNFEISRLQALIWYIGVFVTLLVWVPLKLGYFLPHCCSTKNDAYNPNVDLVNINAYIKFGEILIICSRDIERKQTSDVNQEP